MRRNIRVMLDRRARDRGDVLLMSIGVLAVSSLFVAFIITMAYTILAFSKDSQNATLAQEAADVAVAEAMFVLNEEYGVVSASDEYDSELLLRSLPDATDPASADMTRWNATQQRNQHNVGDDGEYGIQAEATWYVDVFDPHFGGHAAVSDPNRIRQSGQVGNLVVASTVFIPQEGGEPFVLARRSIEVPLFQYQARAVQRGSNDGLSYILSPASMFQFGAVGVGSMNDHGNSGSVRLLTPVASNGLVSLNDPNASFATSADRQRRYDTNVFLFGNARCVDGNAVGVQRCDNDATLSLAFEIDTDVQLMEDVSEFCGGVERDDFIASEQSVATLLANDTTYCFRDFIMDTDVNLVSTSSNHLQRTARIFVERELRVSNGARFTYSGAAATAPQAAFYTRSSDVTFEGSTTNSTLWAYVYAPDATCELGEMPSNPDMRSETRYVGSWVCDTVVLDQAYSIAHRPPYPGLVEFGEFGFGSDVHLNNLWFVNYEATRAVLEEQP